MLNMLNGVCVLNHCLRNPPSAARPGGIAYQVADAVKHLD